MNRKQQLVNWIFMTFREAAWAPLGVICIYATGLAFGLYDLFPALDIPTHLLGGVAITYLYRSAIRNAQTIVGDVPNVIQTILAFTSTSATIIFWEFYENTLDFFFGTHNVRGLEDTIHDMVFGLIGALVFSLFYKRR
jgi:hypothetical protein